MSYWRVFVISGILAGSALAAGWTIYLIRADQVMLTFSSDIQNFWNRIYYMFALSVLIERSVEVYLKIGNMDGGKVNPQTGGVNPPATATALTVALVISVILAVVGIRLLGTLVELTIANQSVGEAVAKDKVLAQTLFYGIDVLISAGLMAGGSVVFHPLIKSLTLIFESMQAGAQRRVDVLEGKDIASSKQVADRRAVSLDLSTDEIFAPLSLEAVVGFSVAELNLIEPAKTGAQTLRDTHPDEVVFLSGRRTVASQAEAMAENVLLNRKWIEETYAPSSQRNALQKWVNDHPEAVTKADIAAGLASVMAPWSDEDKLKISRHLAGLAFDLKPVAGANGVTVKKTIADLPNLRRFLDTEGGLVRWHAEFNTA